jgi:hypothetical protein
MLESEMPSLFRKYWTAVCARDDDSLLEARICHGRECQTQRHCSHRRIIQFLDFKHSRDQKLFYTSHLFRTVHRWSNIYPRLSRWWSRMLRERKPVSVQLRELFRRFCTKIRCKQRARTWTSCRQREQRSLL